MISYPKHLLALCFAWFTLSSVAQTQMFPGSTILDSWSDGRLATWVDPSQQFQASLLYTMSLGDDSQDFHAAVDGNSTTMVIIQTVGGYVFGGYNNGTWQGPTSGFYEPDLDAKNFLFSINSETKWPIRSDRLEYGTYNRDTYGPTFGGGHDIYLQSDLSTGYCYAWAYAPEGSVYEGQNLSFAGSYNSWTVQSIEVWQMNTSGAAVSYTVGCVDPLACNYDETSDYSDLSCDFETCYGCMDPASCNYDNTATMNGGCDYLSCNPCGDRLLPGSSITTAADDLLFAEWLGAENQFSAELLYDSDTDGLSSLDFHAHADGVQGTLTLIETTDGFVFGGYNHYEWEGPSSGYYTTDTELKNFLFSLTNETKWTIRPDRAEYSTYNRNTYGPTFGGGHDIYLNSDMSTGYCYAWAYEVPGQPYEGQNLTFAGSYNGWTVASVEVYDIKTSGAAWDSHPGGCLDPTACNYEPAATCDNGLCDYSGGCTDAGACNYNPMAFCDDGSCEFASCIGCMDDMACNYNPTATADDGSCEYTSCLGCTDAMACNYDETATIDDASCEYLSCAGCTDAVACNYDETATIDDSFCEYLSCAGCTDAGACNYDVTATLDDGSCDYLTCAGCTDMLACEYDPTATLDDGSCLTYPGQACDDGNELTVDDTVQGDCGCEGTILDPSVIPTHVDYPSGTYDRCDMIKADWVDADDYRFVFEPMSGGAAMVHEQGAPNTFLLLSEVYGLVAGETYQVTVDAGYDLGLSELYWMPGTVTTDITIALPTTVVNPNDDCASHGPHFLGDYISATEFVCGADKWIWTFQADGEMPITFEKPGAGRFVRLTAISGLQPGQTYSVTAQAGYPEGGTTMAGSPVCIQLVGEAPAVSSGPEVDPEISLDREVQTVEAAMYPNPNRGDYLVVNLSGINEATVPVTIYALTGAVVGAYTLTVNDGTALETLALGGLAAGTYVVRMELTTGAQQQKLVVHP